MLQMLIAAPNSGSGKTTVTIALLAALKARGLNPCAFKSGPDYIDPMFHRSVLGVESHNLDLFFSKPQIVQNLYNKSATDRNLRRLKLMQYPDDEHPVTNARVVCCLNRAFLKIASKKRGSESRSKARKNFL